MITRMTVRYDARFRDGRIEEGVEWGTYRVSTFDSVLAEAERLARFATVANVRIEAAIEDDEEGR
jgi:hypothetical protein